LANFGFKYLVILFWEMGDLRNRGIGKLGIDKLWNWRIGELANFGFKIFGNGWFAKLGNWIIWNLENWGIEKWNWQIGEFRNWRYTKLGDSQIGNGQIGELGNWHIGKFRNWRYTKLGNSQIGNLPNWRIRESRLIGKFAKYYIFNIFLEHSCDLDRVQNWISITTFVFRP